MKWIQPTGDGATLSIWVQPKASRSRVVGEYDSWLKVQIAAPPADGEANAELIELLKKILGVPKRDIELVDGLRDRRKRVQVRGISAAEVGRLLTESSR
jgi:uncharacterized protein (TIGR00251 family)